jgi:uncharacterized protein (TIGR00159 family)
MIDWLRANWRDILDVALVSFVYYRLILLVKGTRALSAIYGLVLVLLAYYASDRLGLVTLSWLLANFLGSIFLVVIILFQRDIRKGLADFGAGRLLWRRDKGRETVLDALVEALTSMAGTRTGALVVLEKNVPLGDVVEHGVEIGAKCSTELLLTIFHPGTPLHDGAVIVKNDRIAAAGCILPLSPGFKGPSDYGTRHRAAIGISEESDAVAVVVSEERGEISLAVGGKLTPNLDGARLRRVLMNTWSE